MDLVLIVASLFSLVSLVIFVAFLLLLSSRRRPSSHLPSATVVVTQSPGNHSPRAYAHATAALAANLTDVVVFVAEDPLPPPHPRIIHIAIPNTPPPESAQRTTLSLLNKLVRVTRTLVVTLRSVSRQPYDIHHVILNTPPVLPTLPVLGLLRPFLFPAACLTLDCHNLAFTLMRLTSSPLIVALATAAEAFSFKLAHNHWAVSETLCDYIRRNFRVHPVVLYDRPRAEFLLARDEPPVDIAALMRRHATIVAADNHPFVSAEPCPTMRTLVSSSSWTPDEDFAMLLSVLRKLDGRQRPLLIILTGKGPLRAAFECSVADLHLKNIAVAFAWLPIADYPLLLAACDIGLCFHASSSGLDLPMKAVDMLGAGLPVLALRYKCIRELVVPQRDGFLFERPAELVALIDRLLLSDGEELALLRESVNKETDVRSDWQSHWEHNALPTLRVPE